MWFYLVGAFARLLLCVAILLNMHTTDQSVCARACSGCSCMAFRLNIWALRGTVFAEYLVFFNT